MALPIEETIMKEIGFGTNYSWFNGSGSCQYIRQQAASRLSSAIQEEHDKDPQAIAAPNQGMIRLLTDVASRGDLSRYSLARTWQAASYIIAEHIHTAGASEVERNEAFKKLEVYIRREYFKADR